MIIICTCLSTIWIKSSKERERERERERNERREATIIKSLFPLHLLFIVTILSLPFCHEGVIHRTIK